jgi:hypothetical protein
MMAATHDVANMAGGFLAALFLLGVLLFLIARR